LVYIIGPFQVFKARQLPDGVTQGPDLGASLSLCGYRLRAVTGWFNLYCKTPQREPPHGLSQIQIPFLQKPFSEQLRLFLQFVMAVIIGHGKNKNNMKRNNTPMKM